MKNLSLLLIFYLFAFCNIGCDEDTTLQSGHQAPVPPPMTDAIPYAVLGEGKIAFERIRPIGNNYHGVYVINIDGQTSSIIGKDVGGGVTISQLFPNIKIKTFKNSIKSLRKYFHRYDENNYRILRVGIFIDFLE